MDLLSSEHDAIVKRSKEEKWRGLKKSIVEEVFGGEYLNTVLCLDCMRVSRTRDPMIDMSVTISFKQNTGMPPESIRKMVKAPVQTQIASNQSNFNKKKTKKSFFRSVLLPIFSFVY